MNRTNIMPPARMAAKRRAGSIRQWKIIAGCYTGVVVCVCSATQLMGANQAAVDTAPVRGDLQKARGELAARRVELDGERSKLASVMEISDQPDWSILLAVVSRTLGDDVVLNLIDSGPAAAGDTPGHFTMTGVGCSQPAIAQFVLRLEALGLFSRVELVQTSPRPFAGTDGIGFTLDCRTVTGGVR